MDRRGVCRWQTLPGEGGWWNAGGIARGGGAWRWSDVNGRRLLLDTETVEENSLV